MIANIDGTNPRIFHDNRWEASTDYNLGFGHSHTSGTHPFGLPAMTTGGGFTTSVTPDYRCINDDGIKQSNAPNPGAGAGSQHKWVQWSPDGNTVMYATASRVGVMSQNPKGSGAPAISGFILNMFVALLSLIHI